MKIAIHGRKFSVESVPYIQQVFDELKQHKVEVQVSEPFKRILLQSGIRLDTKAVYTTPEEIFDADFAFSLGGDGTFLETLAHVGKREIPILGFNFGRLGFLAAISPEKIQRTVYQLINGYYTVDERTMISAASETELFEEGTNFALNEIAISKTDTSSMIVVHAYINGEFLNTYWADGLIVSTPTGSTGYSLSCNGPILFPDAASFVITPVAPHNLNVRTIVIPDTNVVSFEIEGRADQFICALDARKEIVDKTVQLAIRKEQFCVNLVRLNENSFLSTLRTKLTWGLDKRN